MPNFEVGQRVRVESEFDVLWGGKSGKIIETDEEDKKFANRLAYLVEFDDADLPDLWFSQMELELEAENAEETKVPDGD